MLPAIRVCHAASARTVVPGPHMTLFAVVEVVLLLRVLLLLWLGAPPQKNSLQPQRAGSHRTRLLQPQCSDTGSQAAQHSTALRSAAQAVG